MNHVEQVVENNLCCGCGVCKVICPPKSISLNLKNGVIIAQINKSSCINCGKCINVCPGKGYDYSAYNFKNESEFFIGNINSIYRVQAKNKEIVRTSTSGGFIQQAVISLLKREKFDSAYLVDEYNISSPLGLNRYEKESNFQDISKSRYLPVSFSNVAEHMLMNKNEKIIIVGTSCCISGINNLIDMYKLNRDNYLLIGLFCDRTMTYNIKDYFERKSEKFIDKFYFREKNETGWPGSVKIQYSDGETRNYDQTTRMYLKDYFQPERCLYCVDKLNIGADISVGDDYISEERDNEGANTIIIRTDNGKFAWNAIENCFLYDRQNVNMLFKAQNFYDKKLNFSFSFNSQINNIYSFKPNTKSIDKILKEKKRKINLGNEMKFKEIDKEISIKYDFSIWGKIKRKILKDIFKFTYLE